MKLTQLTSLTLAAVSALAIGASAATQDFSFTGTFLGDSDVQLFEFQIGATSDVTLRSYSYAGGTMADGTVIAAGGFDPILALWDGAGNLVEAFDDGPEAVPADPVTGREFDTNLQLTGLAPGTYTASIAQYENFPNGLNLSDGFVESDAFFTAVYGCSNGQFCDVASDNRTNAWAFDVLGVDQAVATDADVPLPAGLPLILTGMIALGLISRRQNAS